MPDRRRRAAFRFPLPTALSPSPGPRQGGIGPAALPAAVLPGAALSETPRPGTALPAPRTALPAGARGPAASAVRLLREGRSQPPEAEDNPFAPPPEGRPDQPWQPRGPQGGDSGSAGNDGGGSGEEGRGGGGEGEADGGQSRWSSHQPRPQKGGFGMGSGFGQRQNGGNGPGGGPGGPGGLRWDPTDPIQRRARYALLAGMWGFFFSLFSVPEIGLLLGVLAVYWGISSLRGKQAGKQTGTQQAANGVKPQTSAAVSGLVTGVISLSIVAATFAFQFVYRDYFTCVDDALTYSSRQSCEHHLPQELRPLLRPQD